MVYSYFMSLWQVLTPVAVVILGFLFVIQLMLFTAAVLVNSTANLISCFMADLQPNTLKENMAAVLSLLATQGLVNKAIKQITYAYT